MDKDDKVPVAERVRDFLARNIDPPELIADPATGQQYLKPAAYKFDGVFKEEFERIARAASAASGIVPTPEDLTAEAMAQIQAQAEQEQQARRAGPKAGRRPPPGA